MSTWERLKQRKIVQWGLAYVAGAFALLQALQLVAQPFAWPDLVLKAATVVLGIGFFAALIIAWYHGERGQQRVTTIELAMLTALLVIAGVAIAFVSRKPADASTSKASAASAAPAGTIAVLPFQNMSAQAENEYFSDGITEEILNVLAKVPGLQVAARTSSFQFKGQQVDIRDAASRLGVRHVLEGSVQRINDRVRITAQLIDATSGMHLWSERYDRELKDVFAVEAEIANQIATALRGRLGSVGSARASAVSVDPAAHDAYLHGRALVLTGEEQSIRRALGYFDRALAIDSTFALGHFGKAYAYMLLADAYEVPKQQYRLAGESARRALELDPGLAEAQAFLAFTRMQSDRNMAAAIAAADQALALAPNSVDVLLVVSQFHCFNRPGPEATAFAEKAVRIDPLSVVMSWNLEWCRLTERDYDGVIETHKKTRALAPGFAFPDDFAAIAYREKGDLQAALREYEHLPNGGTDQTGLAITYARLGRKAEAQRILDGVVAAAATRYITPSIIAAAYAQLGNLTEARKWAAKIVETGDTSGPFMSPFISDYKPLMADPVAGKILRDERQPRN